MFCLVGVAANEVCQDTRVGVCSPKWWAAGRASEPHKLAPDFSSAVDLL